MGQTVKTTPENVEEPHQGLFHATMNLPEAAANCGMSLKRNYKPSREYLKYHESDFENPSSLSWGKSRAVRTGELIPNLDEYHVYREPFLGGGSVALWVTQKYPNLRVWVNDLYEPLTNFWKVLQDDGDKLRYKLS